MTILSEGFKTQDHVLTVQRLEHKLASVLIRPEVSNDELVVLQ